MWTLGLILACQDDTRTVSGAVVDIWGKPVPDATVVIEGVMERHHTDASGAFSIDAKESELVMHAEGDSGEANDAALALHAVRVLVGKPGYIKQVVAAPEHEEKGDFEGLKFSLYPAPPAPGFYAVGHSAYVALGHQRIQMVGTDLAHYAGVQDIPDETISPGKLDLVFTTRLRPSEIAQMNLHLSHLEFVNKTKIKGVFGAEDATVNLWVAKDDVPFDIVGFDTREDYLITTRDELTPGMYAFHAHDILHEEDERVLYSLPKEQQVAFPFEVK